MEILNLYSYSFLSHKSKKKIYIIIGSVRPAGSRDIVFARMRAWIRATRRMGIANT